MGFRFSRPRKDAPTAAVARQPQPQHPDWLTSITKTSQFKKYLTHNLPFGLRDLLGAGVTSILVGTRKSPTMWTNSYSL